MHIAPAGLHRYYSFGQVFMDPLAKQSGKTEGTLEHARGAVPELDSAQIGQIQTSQIQTREEAIDDLRIYGIYTQFLRSLCDQDRLILDLKANGESHLNIADQLGLDLADIRRRLLSIRQSYTAFVSERIAQNSAPQDPE